MSFAGRFAWAVFFLLSAVGALVSKRFLEFSMFSAFSAYWMIKAWEER